VDYVAVAKKLRTVGSAKCAWTSQNLGVQEEKSRSAYKRSVHRGL